MTGSDQKEEYPLAVRHPFPLVLWCAPRPPISRHAWCEIAADRLAEAALTGAMGDLLDGVCRRLRLDPVRLCEAIRDEQTSQGGT